MIVQDPMVRAISDYTQLSLNKNNSFLPKFEEFVTKEVSVLATERGIVKIEVYINHLHQWLMYFPFSCI